MPKSAMLIFMATAWNKTMCKPANGIEKGGGGEAVNNGNCLIGCSIDYLFGYLVEFNWQFLGLKVNLISF